MVKVPNMEQRDSPPGGVRRYDEGNSRFSNAKLPTTLIAWLSVMTSVSARCNEYVVTSRTRVLNGPCNALMTDILKE